MIILAGNRNIISSSSLLLFDDDDDDDEEEKSVREITFKTVPAADDDKDDESDSDDKEEEVQKEEKVQLSEQNSMQQLFDEEASVSAIEKEEKKITMDSLGIHTSITNSTPAWMTSVQITAFSPPKIV